MPRGIKKTINYTEEIERIEARITHHTNSIKELKERRLELENQKRMEELKKLDTFLTNHNIIPEDLINLYNAQRLVNTQA